MVPIQTFIPLIYLLLPLQMLLARASLNGFMFPASEYVKKSMEGWEGGQRLLAGVSVSLLKDPRVPLMPSTHHCVLSLPSFPSCGSLLPGLSWSLSAPLHSAGIHLFWREWQERPLSSSFRCECPEMQACSCRSTSLPEERSPSILLVLLLGCHLP